MKGKSESEVAQLCLTLRDPMDCILPGSSIHGIFQTRVLECGAITFSGPMSLTDVNYSIAGNPPFPLGATGAPPRFSQTTNK